MTTIITKSKATEESIKDRKVVMYCRVATEAQLNGGEETATLEKKLFRTLKNYSHGFCRNATEAEKKAYNAKVDELKTKILADVEHAPEIIAEEFATHQASMYRAQMTGKYATLKCNAEWKAVDNVCMALVDAKPFKSAK